MSGKAALRNWIFAFAITAAWVWMDRALAPLDLTLAMALLFVLACGIWASSGRLLPLWTRTPRLCGWAAVWATVATFVFKRLFGRAGPDPAYVHDHLYGFRLLHSGPHWHSFPSGTAAISVAIVSVLWILLPRWRALGVLIATLLCVTVVLTNYHWVGDVIAGTFLGAFIGWMTVRVAMLGERRKST